MLARKDLLVPLARRDSRVIPATLVLQVRKVRRVTRVMLVRLARRGPLVRRV